MKVDAELMEAALETKLVKVTVMGTLIEMEPTPGPLGLVMGLVQVLGAVIGAAPGDRETHFNNVMMALRQEVFK